MDRESFMPLVVSALLAVALHASVFFWPDLSQVQGKVQQQPVPAEPLPAPEPELPKLPEPLEPPEPPQPEPKPPEPKPEPRNKPEAAPEPEAAVKPKPLEIGRDGEPIRSTVAWIPYDDFKELMAAQSLTIQPAFQQQADPIADAPVEMNPSSPKPTPVLIPNPTAAQQQQQEQESTPANATPMHPPSQAVAPVAAVPAPPVDSAASANEMTSAEPRADAQAVPQDVSQDATSQTPVSSSAPEVAAAAEDSAVGRSADISLPPGTGDPPLATNDASTNPLPPDQHPQVRDGNRPDVTEDSQASTSPTRSTPSSEVDDRRLALAPLKVPREPALPQASSLQNNDSKPLPPDKQPTPAAPAAVPAQTPRAAASSTDSNEDRPTSVPRSDRESIATQTAPMPDRIVLGKVLVSDGIEIKTVRPQLNISTLYTASPRNPVATIIFDKSGQVVHAQIIRSSGFADVDSPVLNSLYRWRASGKKLQEHKSDTFTIARMTLLFVEERKTSSESIDAPDSSDARTNSSDSNPSPDSAGTPDAPASE